MRKLFLTAALLLTFASVAAAQNPCTPVDTNEIVGATNHFFATLPSHNAQELDGTRSTLAYQYGAWLATTTDPGATPPLQGPSTIPWAAFVPVAGFADCYQLTGGLPGLIPEQRRLRVSMRAQSQPPLPGQTNPPAPFSAWAPLSNSFQAASPRTTAQVPGRGQIRP